jgi:hypothetical protein
MNNHGDESWAKPGPGARKSRAKTFVSWLIVSIGAAVCISLALYPNPRVTEFNSRTSDQMVVGKAPEQIVQLLGKPAFQTDVDSNGYQSFTYAGPGGRCCRIDFQGGVAKGTYHWTK